MVDHVVMFTLLAFMGALGAIDALALRHGADSRIADGRPNL